MKGKGGGWGGGEQEEMNDRVGEINKTERERSNVVKDITTVKSLTNLHSYNVSLELQ